MTGLASHYDKQTAIMARRGKFVSPFGWLPQVQGFMEQRATTDALQRMHGVNAMAGAAGVAEKVNVLKRARPFKALARLARFM